MVSLSLTVQRVQWSTKPSLPPFLRHRVQSAESDIHLQRLAVIIPPSCRWPLPFTTRLLQTLSGLEQSWEWSDHNRYLKCFNENVLSIFLCSRHLIVMQYMPFSMHLHPESHPPANNHGTKYSAKIIQWVFHCWTFCHQYYSFEKFTKLVHISSGFPSIQIGSAVLLFVCFVDRGVSWFCAFYFI